MIVCPSCPTGPLLARRDHQEAPDDLSAAVEGYCPACHRVWRIEAVMTLLAGPVEVHDDYLPHDDLLGAFG